MLTKKVILILAVATSASLSIAAETTVIVGGTVIDGTGSKPLADATIVIREDRIAEVGPVRRVSIPEGAKRIDATGKFVLPGFIDLHVHFMDPPDAVSTFTRTEALSALRASYFMDLFVGAGITAVRDTGGTVESMQALLAAQELGYIDSLRLFPVGQLITTTGGHGQYFSYEASGPYGFREAVRKMYKAGFRHIKLSPTYTQEEVDAAVDEAKTLGMQVTSHGGGFSDTNPPTMTRRAVLAGVESIEHLNDTPLDVLDLMAERGVQIVPTLAIYEALYSMPIVPANLQHLIDTRGWSMALHERIFKEAVKRDIMMGIGTDAIANILDTRYPQLYFDEMSYFVKLGVSRLDTIVAATGVGAIIMNREKDIGTIEAGKLADLQIIDGNPLESFDVLGKPEVVMIGGRVLVDRRQ